MNIESERERLSQAKFLLWIRNQMELGEMVTVYWSEIENQHNYGVYPVLIPTSKIEESLSDPSWHSTYGDGSPGTVQYYREGEEKIEYLRFGNDEGLEPLVIDRYFDGVRPTYKELGRRSAERHPHPQNLARCPRRTRSRMTNRTLCSFSDLSSLSTSVSLSQGGHLAALAEHHAQPSHSPRAIAVCHRDPARPFYGTTTCWNLVFLRRFPRAHNISCGNPRNYVSRRDAGALGFSCSSRLRNLDSCLAGMTESLCAFRLVP